MISTSHLHPMLVHFPIVIIMIAFLADAINMIYKKEPCLSKVGFYLMILGSLSAIAAVLTGTFLTSELEGRAGEIKETHEVFANVTMYILIVTTILRSILVWKKQEELSFLKWIVLTLQLITVVTVGITGFLGGKLVYEFMIGI